MSVGAAGPSRPTALLVCALAAALGAFFWACKHVPALSAVCPFLQDPVDAVGSFGIQLAALAAAAGALRSFAPPRAGEPAGSRALLSAQAWMLAVLAAEATLLADLVQTVRSGFPWFAGGAWRLTALFAAVGLLTALVGRDVSRALRDASGPAPRPASILDRLPVLLLVVAILSWPAAWRAHFVGAILTALAGMALLFLFARGRASALLSDAPAGSPGLAEDLIALARRRPRRHGAAADPDAPPGAPPRGSAFDPGRRPWLTVSLLGVLAGLAIAMADRVVEGGPAAPRRLLLVTGVLVGIEGSGVVLGYALLGRYLGVFRRP